MLSECLYWHFGAAPSEVDTANSRLLCVDSFQTKKMESIMGTEITPTPPVPIFSRYSSPADTDVDAHLMIISVTDEYQCWNWWLTFHLHGNYRWKKLPMVCFFCRWRRNSSSVTNIVSSFLWRNPAQESHRLC